MCTYIYNKRYINSDINTSQNNNRGTECTDKSRRLVPAPNRKLLEKRNQNFQKKEKPTCSMHLPAPLLEGLARNSSWRRLLPLFRLLRLVCDPDLGSPPPSGTSSVFLLEVIVMSQREHSYAHLYFTKTICPLLVPLLRCACVY